METEGCWNYARFTKELGIKYRKSQESVPGHCDTSGWSMEYSTFQMNLLRYRIDTGHTCHFCSIGKGVFEDSIHVLGRMYPPDTEEHRAIWAHFHMIKKLVGPNACRHAVMRACKIATGLLKLGGPYITPAWRVLAYWELAYGYVPYKDNTDMIPEVREWLCTHRVLGGFLPEDLYLEFMFYETVEFMASEWITPPEWLPPSDWARSGKWMEGKAGTGQKHTLEVGGKRVRTRRMKPLQGVFVDDDSARKELSLSCREEMHVIQKSESGKIRPVVKTGDCLNRKMNYLSEVVERGLYGSRLSSLFAGDRGNEEIDLDLLSAVKDGSDWCVPLDQGAFDQHQSKKSVLVVLAGILSYVLPRIGNSEVQDIGAALWDSLNVRGATVTCGKEDLGMWNNGLPSGWRWTALLDTVLNICSFRVIKKLCERARGHEVTIRHFYAQGDDVIFTCPDLHDIRDIINLYGIIGYEVHPEKTYLSRYRGEFLRRNYEPWGITGYTARTIVGLRFRNPIQEVPLLRGERTYSRLVQWHLAVMRGCHASEVAEMFLEDCQQGGIPRVHAASFALTPSSVGGGGVDPDSRLGRALLPHSDGKWRVCFTEKELRPVNVNLGIWERRIDETQLDIKGEVRANIINDLIASWGIREQDRVGKRSYSMNVVERVEPLLPTRTEILPTDDDMWDLRRVPIQIRGQIKRQAIRANQLSMYMRPGWDEWARRLYKRVSTRVAEGILTSTFSLPCVLSDCVGVRYGLSIKDRAWKFLGGILLSRNCGLLRVERGMLWIEQYIRNELKSLGSSVILAQ
ncbi:putative poly-capsid [Linepithema humile toti-like virus 1]|nr:putative poly-capsid [Linepithema humile toti-like virus 1]